MFGKTTRYLLVDISTVEKKEYAVKRESLCLDFVTVYYDKGWTYARKYFDLNNVPLEFQKIIVEITSSCFSKNIEEFFVGYHFSEAKFKRENDSKSKKIYALGKIFDGNIVVDNIRLNSDIYYIGYDEVVSFYQNLNDKGYLKRYLSSLSQLFNLGKNIDSLAVSFLEEKASKKAKSKSYNQNNINCKG